MKRGDNVLMVQKRKTRLKCLIVYREILLQYINDLERDRKYNSWPSSVQDLLRPTFPGMLRHIRKNLFHMVIIAYYSVVCVWITYFLSLETIILSISASLWCSQSLSTVHQM